jgi:hypothetical protein
MADHPELYTDRTPERQRSALDRAPTFGVAREAETYVAAPPDELPARKPRRERGPFVTYLQLPWSYGDRRRSDVWHRMQCRRGRHQMSGGDTMQVGGALVFIERRCRWCEAGAD